MSCRAERWLPWRTVASMLVLLLGVQTARAESLSVKEFNEKLEGWKKVDKDPSLLTLEVEGRVKIYSKDRLTLENCKVMFRTKTEFPERTRKSLNVVVIGKVSRDPRTSEHTFQVSSIRIVPGEHEQFIDKYRQLKQTATADDWYALGRWAAIRGEFYADDKLLSNANEANQHGLEIERKARSKDDPEGLLELADKAKKFRMLSLANELRHEAFHLLCERSRGQPAADLQKLAVRLESELPGANAEQRFIPSDLINDYKRRPIPTYAAADAATRLILHRWLYVDLQLRLITPRLKSDGSNGFEIADQIDRIIHEQHGLAEEFRDRALKSRAAEVEKLTRSEVIELFEKYRLRNQSRAANDLLESWLTLRKRGLESDDTEGLLNLSEDYRRLLKRDDLADRLLIDGWIRNPKASDLQERLEKEGYRLFEGHWISEQEFASRPEGKLELAIRNGLVASGMTASQVRRSRGKPDSKSRSATAGQVTEIWTYRMADSSQLVVRFVKRAGQPEMSVAEVLEGKGR